MSWWGRRKREAAWREERDRITREAMVSFPPGSWLVCCIAGCDWKHRDRVGLDASGVFDRHLAEAHGIVFEPTPPDFVDEDGNEVYMKNFGGTR